MLRVSAECVHKENHYDLEFGTVHAYSVRQELLLLVHEKKEKQTSHARVHYIWVIGNSATRTSGGKKDRETKEIISQRVKIWLALFLTASF
jgi:hypothetical protein